jgi:NAD(P)-dependent dehydrogenase (short-subunit alcohol dehydrogenase family)
VWNQDIEVGLTGAFLCAKYYGYQISKNLEGGSIINISSDLGLIAPDQKLYMHEGLLEEQQPVKPVSYSVVKAGIIGLTRYLSTYWSDKNVRCNAMCLGGVENNLPDNFMKKVVTKIPMNRLAKSNEYQGSLVWMLSDASSYLNGAIIPIEGGRTAW